MNIECGIYYDGPLFWRFHANLKDYLLTLNSVFVNHAISSLRAQIQIGRAKLEYASWNVLL